jgi:hypothetical protein
MEKAIASRFPHVPLLRAALGSQIQIVMPEARQTVPLADDEDPDQSTVVYVDAFSGWTNEPKHWACSDGILRWARLALILGASQTHEFPFRYAAYRAVPLSRVVIIRCPDLELDKWEALAQKWMPGNAVSFRPHPHYIQAGVVVPIDPGANPVQALMTLHPGLSKEEVIRLARELGKDDSQL